MSRQRRTRVASVTALTFTTVVLVAMHTVRRDVDPVMQPLSAYALGPAGEWMSAALCTWGLSGWLLPLMLPYGSPRAARLLLWVFGAGLMVSAVFPMDVPFPPTPW